eukprot:1160783-Pelagomonas_calceolata.AAC.6
MARKRKRKVYAGLGPRALRKGPLTSKLARASPRHQWHATTINSTTSCYHTHFVQPDERNSSTSQLHQVSIGNSCMEAKNMHGCKGQRCKPIPIYTCELHQPDRHKHTRTHTHTQARSSCVQSGKLLCRAHQVVSETSHHVRGLQLTRGNRPNGGIEDSSVWELPGFDVVSKNQFVSKNESQLLQETSYQHLERTSLPTHREGESMCESMRAGRNHGPNNGKKSRSKQNCVRRFLGLSCKTKTGCFFQTSHSNHHASIHPRQSPQPYSVAEAGLVSDALTVQELVSVASGRVRKVARFGQHHMMMSFKWDTPGKLKLKKTTSTLSLEINAIVRASASVLTLTQDQANSAASVSVHDSIHCLCAFVLMQPWN